MVEIALCLGIIAFALVAIIGVLPTGMRVQKENREDTVINQDGTFLLEAIRSGSRNLDYLTNYFDSITLSNKNQVVIFTNSPGLEIPGNPRIEGSLTNGLRIVGLLTFPKYPFNPLTGRIMVHPATGNPASTNIISGYIRALSGSAMDKSRPADRTTREAIRDFAFAYQFHSEVIPLSPYPREFTNYVQAINAGLPPDEVATRSNLWLMACNQAFNFSELRLTLQGPVIRRGQTLEAVGTPKTFRTIITGTVSNYLNNFSGFFVQPSTFVQVAP